MPIIFSPLHRELENKIKLLLADTLKKGEMDVKAVVTLCAILGCAENEEELNRLMKIFSADYPILSTFVSAEEETAHEEIEVVVQEYLRELIQTDPLRAVLVGQDAANKKITLAELRTKYPEFDAWIQKNKK
jgi:hypothetical protein